MSGVDIPRSKYIATTDIQVGNALYLVPECLCGQTLSDRVGGELVKLFFRGQLVKIHLCQPAGPALNRPGHRVFLCDGYRLFSGGVEIAWHGVGVAAAGIRFGMVDPGSPAVQGLLGELAGSARAERAELVGWLLEQGMTVEEIGNAPIPMLLASRRIIGVDDRYVSARDISESHGVELALVQRVQRGLGLARADDPDAAVYLQADGQIAAYLQKFRQAGLDPEHLVQVIDVATEGIWRTAEVMRYTGLAAVFRLGATELEIAQRSQALVERIAPLLGPWIADMLFLQLRNRADTETVTADERAAGHALPGARKVTVAFADLVGFTHLGEEISAEQLEGLAHWLTDRARDVAVPPVRFVKTVGDAVMFICSDPDPGRLLDAVLKLLGTAEAGLEVQLRIGVASGSAVSRAGDWFGSPINIASRVTGLAQPGTVLVTEPVAHELDGASGFGWTCVDHRHLKGVPDAVKLFRAWRQPRNGPRVEK